MNIRDSFLCYTHNINFLPSINPQRQLFSLIEKIVYLSTVDLKEFHCQSYLLELRLLQKLEHISCCEKIKSWNIISFSHHCISFATASLTICKAAHFGSIKCRIYKWPHDIHIKLFIILLKIVVWVYLIIFYLLAVGPVKVKRVLLYVLCEIHLLSKRNLNKSNQTYFCSYTVTVLLKVLTISYSFRESSL